MSTNIAEKRETLADNFRTDPGREMYETSIVAAKDDPMISITTPENGVASRIIRHKEAEIEKVHIIDADNRMRNAGIEEAYEKVNGGEYSVCGVRAELPVGTLRIGKSARDSDRLSDAIYSG